MTGPVKIDYVSTNYTKVHFTNIICSEFNILFLLAAEESPLFKLCSSDKDLALVV